MNTWMIFEKFKKQSLPKKTSFFSRLKQEKVSEKDFEHAQKVWREFELKNMGEYHDLYLKTDVLLLADVMENFRKLCEENYELDPAHFFHCPRHGMGCNVENNGNKVGNFGGRRYAADD